MDMSIVKRDLFVALFSPHLQFIPISFPDLNPLTFRPTFPFYLKKNNNKKKHYYIQYYIYQ